MFERLRYFVAKTRRYKEALTTEEIDELFDIVGILAPKGTTLAEADLTPT